MVAEAAQAAWGARRERELCLDSLGMDRRAWPQECFLGKVRGGSAILAWTVSLRGPRGSSSHGGYPRNLRAFGHG